MLHGTAGGRSEQAQPVRARPRASTYLPPGAGPYTPLLPFGVFGPSAYYGSPAPDGAIYPADQDPDVIAAGLGPVIEFNMVDDGGYIDVFWTLTDHPTTPGGFDFAAVNFDISTDGDNPGAIVQVRSRHDSSGVGNYLSADVQLYAYGVESVFDLFLHDLDGGAENQVVARAAGDASQAVHRVRTVTGVIENLVELFASDDYQYLELGQNQSGAPPNPSSVARLFCAPLTTGDTSAKSKLRARFPTGAAVDIAAEP